MNIVVEEMKQFRVAYIRNIGPYGEANYKTMNKIKTWAKDNNLVNDNLIILGIAEDDPQITRSEDCRYDGCAVIADDYNLNHSEVDEGIINGGKYAVVKIDHTAEAVQKAWSSMFTELHNHNYSLDQTRPIIERYKVGMVKSGYCEICVPIK